MTLVAREPRAVCEKCNADNRTPCAYPDFRYRDCPQQEFRRELARRVANFILYGDTRGRDA